MHELNFATYHITSFCNYFEKNFGNLAFLRRVPLYINVHILVLINQVLPKKSTMANNDNFMVRYEGVSTIVPHKPTFPRPSFPISITKDKQPGIFKLCFHVVLCYNKASREDSGWIVAGWTKTSMGIALSEKPLLAGRLRRVDDGGLEIVPNDSGIRSVEARIDLSMEEFVSLRNKEEVQKQLVCWKSIDDQDPQFSPLMYFQAIYHSLFFKV